MKYRFFLFLFVCFISLFSCSKKNKDIVIINEEDTLKKIIQNKENEVFWTETIDAEILSTELSYTDVLENYNNLNINLVNSISNSFQDCFPFINGIGSLDHSENTEEIFIFISKICNIILKNPENGLDEYFDTDFLFNKTFFIKDLKDIWKNKFNSSYSTKKLFDKYYIGEIQEGFDLTEAKIRFYKENNYIDITLFISQNERKLNLKQIEINL